MHEIVRRINFDILQLQKRINIKKTTMNLSRDLKSLKTIEGEDFNIAFDALYANRILRDSYITQNLFPSTYSAMAAIPEIDFTSSISTELRWHLKIFSVYANVINDFIRKKEQYDEMLLADQLEDAMRILKEIETKYGYSYWLIENQILLNNKLNIESTEKIMNMIDKGFLSTVIGFFDMKSTDDMQARDYEYIIRREISKFKQVYPDLLDVIDWYSYFIAPFAFKMTEQSISHLLDCIKSFPLVDRYLTVIDILESYVAESPEVEVPYWLKRDIKYLGEIEDSTVITYRYILSEQNDRKMNFVIDGGVNYGKELFLSGKLEESYRWVREKIESSPTNISMYIFFIELCQLCNYDINDLQVGSTKKTVISSLNRVLSFADNYDDSLDEIYKICFWSFHANWARDIYNQITKNVQPIGSDDEKIAKKYSNLQYLTIDTVSDNLSINDALDVLKMLSGEKNTLYIPYKISLLEKDYKKAASICKVQSLSELLMLHQGCTFEKYSDYLNSNNPEIYKVNCCKYLWDNMNNKTDYEKAIDYFIHLFIKREQYVILAPVDKFIDYVSACSMDERKNIRVAILYYIYSAYFDPMAKEDLSIACEDFFDLNNITKPSMMKNDSENYSLEQLVYFLRYICIPQILGPVLLTVRSSKELEQERISICQNLRELDPKNEEIYDQEIKDITHKLFLNEGVSTLETHKIQVNTEGIKARISKDLKTVFNKYMYSRNSKLDVFLETIKNIEGGENLTFFSFDTSQIFNEIVTTIRNEFVLGEEYGLDAYLSLNIRHGTLTGQLRAPLIKLNLLAEKIVEKDEYSISNRWLFRIRDRDSEEKAKKAIIQFTQETDAIIEYLKKELIQISTEEKPTNGVFDYALEDSQIKYLQSFLTEKCEFEDFIDFVFDYLWNYTELNLEHMRSVIRNDIKPRYMEAFLRLQETYKELDIDFPEANQWIKEAQNDMDAELEKICDWFRRSSDGQYPDFELDSAFQVGLQTIKNIHPSMKFKVNYIEKKMDGKLEGAAWKYFVSIFYILFDNVSKYAQEDDGIKKIDCILKSDKQGIYIKMENRIDCDNDLSAKIEKINSAMGLISNASYLAKAKQEGGSGIPKIYKMLAIDLKMKPNVKCDIVEEQQVFRVEIGGKYVEDSCD